ncbi:Prostaglandin reductase 2, partial [Gryganskiella cystojenkinii]
MTPTNKNTRILRAKHVVKGQGFTRELFKSDVVDVNTTLQENEVLIRTLYVALDPYIRYSFSADSGHGSEIDSTVAGAGVGEVIESKNAKFPKNSIVLGLGFAWEEYTKVSGPALGAFVVIPEARNHPKIALTQYLN